MNRLLSPHVVVMKSCEAYGELVYSLKIRDFMRKVFVVREVPYDGKFRYDAFIATVPSSEK